ncbi:hypothetical protein LXA43DRAFT_1178791 [Ganoderma leucocontextum]|nr:hypothetical protein LXA43DRAFT_1178791 [Ganoderma leucocontextum]
MSTGDTSSRPSKRARPLWEQFWFDDGNIILVVQHNGFRIYRGLLAEQSTIFAEMRSVFYLLIQMAYFPPCHDDPIPMIHALWEWSQLIEKLGGICDGCVQVLCERDKAERRQIWDALPQILRITVEGWTQPDGGEGGGNAA